MDNPNVGDGRKDRRARWRDGVIVGFLVNLATLRKASRERQKRDLEIAQPHVRRKAAGFIRGSAD